MSDRLTHRVHAFSPACLTLSAAALGHALQIANGFYNPIAIGWLTLAIALCAVGAVVFPETSLESSDTDLALKFVLLGAIGWQVFALFTSPPAMYLLPRANLATFRAGVVAEAMLVALGGASLKKVDRLWFPALLIVHFLLGRWLFVGSPTPQIDVVVVHRAAIDALLQGRNPYAITFDSIYGNNLGFYGEGAVVDSRVTFGFPYPPLSLLLAVPGQLVAGDYRYSELAAMVGAACLMGYARPTVTSRLAAALFLTQPRGFFVLEQGWTEPIAVLMVALAVYAMIRSPRFAGWIGGLAVVAKQYLVLAAPLVLRFARSQPPGDAHRFVSRAVVAATAVTVPLLLWHPRSFINSIVLVQAREPIRSDSLSYLSWGFRQGWGEHSMAWAAGAALVALTISMIRTRNTPAGFAASLALSSLATFAFGSKAFCNYYFFVVGVLCCAIAARESTRS